MEKSVYDHQTILKEELSRRMSANPLYSLRAFARDLKLSPQYLSNVMNGRKGVSSKMALQLAERLGLSESEKDFFLSLIQSRFARSTVIKKMAQTKLETLYQTKEKTSSLTLDSFRVISDWYHFGMVELLKISGSQSGDISYLAKKLGIQNTEAELALERLLRLELISKTKKGYVVNQETLLTSDGVPSDALKKFHKQVLEKAAAAITLQTVEERILSASFMPIVTSDVPKAKKMIQEFREKFTKQFSKEEGGNAVYALSLQFFNLTLNMEK